MEAFYFHHGPRFAPPKGNDYVKDKVAIDVDAFHRESAVFLSQYAKEVYSFDISDPNFQILHEVLAQNPMKAKRIHQNMIRIGDKPSQSD
jgi:hypothetical protein